MSTFPSILSTYTNPTPSNKLNAPSHSSIEGSQNSGLMQLEAVIGVEGAASVVGSLQYVIKSPASNGGGHIQTVPTGGTGQTSFNKGDILIGQSSSVLTKLAAGTDGYSLLADSTQAVGVKWGTASTAPTVRVYSSPSVLTWSKPSLLAFIVVEVQGAGAGGGGVNAGGSPGSAGGGGGGGGYARKIFSASALSSIATITVGTGGTGGAAGDNDGVSGTGSSFFISASSSVLGGGGVLGGKGTSNAGGGGGVASGGDLNLNGQSGNTGSATTIAAFGGAGGSSFWGKGGIGKPLANGKQGDGPGSSGAGGHQISNTASGGDGRDGQVIVTEYQ